LRENDAEGLFIFDVENQEISGGAKIERGKVRRVSFAGPDHVILQASLAGSRWRYPGSFEFPSTASYNINTNELVTLLRRTPGVSTGDGVQIIAYREGQNEVFMPALTFDRRYEVFKVDLDTGRGKRFLEAGFNVWDWFVDSDGNVVAREDFNRIRESYSIRTIRNGDWVSVYERATDEPPFSLVGVKPDKSALVAYFDPKEEGYSSLFELSFKGETSDPVFARTDAEIDTVYTDINRTVLGVQYSGLYPTYEFYDKELTGLVAAVQAKFPTASVILEGWTADFSKTLFQIAGSRQAPAYYLFERANGALLKIANAYDGITDADVGEILTIQYKARDGLRIPALVTLPPTVSEIRNLPMIVMPHGGPESYVGVGFDWMAQYFASRGYLVFQPNFRGSGGFGVAFKEAGHGEWGGKMQDDITDGVNLLVRQGWSDPERICIMGANYGGYAALAGGAFTPGLYQCIAAIAPISNVVEILKTTKRDSGSRSLTFDNVERMIGDLRDDRAKIEDISPVNHAANFTAPVLLIHGEDDAVLPLLQSTQMKDALEAAGKPVRYVVLKGEDHWLSKSETRLQTLQELDKFVAETIGRAN
jgi:dipeptidyl aminopeptidase/acylaminoacyl peptidase